MAILPVIHGTSTKQPLVKQVNGVWLPMVAADPCICCETALSCDECLALQTQVFITIGNFHAAYSEDPGTFHPSPWFCGNLINYGLINGGYALPRISTGVFSQSFGSSLPLSEWTPDVIFSRKYYLDSIDVVATCGVGGLGWIASARIRVLTANVGACQTGPPSSWGTGLFPYRVGQSASAFAEFCTPGSTSTGTGEMAPYSPWDDCGVPCESILLQATVGF